MEAEIEHYRKFYRIVLALREARASSGLTQGQLSKKSGIPQATISKIENGKRNVTIDTLDQLASAMGKELVLEVR